MFSISVLLMSLNIPCNFSSHEILYQALSVISSELRHIGIGLDYLSKGYFGRATVRCSYRPERVITPGVYSSPSSDQLGLFLIRLYAIRNTPNRFLMKKLTKGAPNRSIQLVVLLLEAIPIIQIVSDNNS